jgi:DNA-binding NarL/FixJ family response regulator
VTQEELSRLLSFSEADQTPMDLLDDREVEVVSLLSVGYGFERAAVEMGIDEQAMTLLARGIRKKLKLKNDSQLLQFAARQSG